MFPKAGQLPSQDGRFVVLSKMQKEKRDIGDSSSLQGIFDHQMLRVCEERCGRGEWGPLFLGPLIPIIAPFCSPSQKLHSVIGAK